MASTSSGSASTSGPNLAQFSGLNPTDNPLLAAAYIQMLNALDPKTATLFTALLDPKNNSLAGLDPTNLLDMFGGLHGQGLANLGPLTNPSIQTGFLGSNANTAAPYMFPNSSMLHSIPGLSGVDFPSSHSSGPSSSQVLSHDSREDVKPPLEIEIEDDEQ